MAQLLKTTTVQCHTTRILRPHSLSASAPKTTQYLVQSLVFQKKIQAGE